MDNKPNIYADPLEQVTEDMSEPIAENENSGTELTTTEDNALATQDRDNAIIVPIGDQLVELGLISQDQLDIAVKIQKDDAGTRLIGQILVEMGFITESTLGQIMSEATGVKQFDPAGTIIDPDLVKQIPKEVAIRYNAVPILLEDKSVYVAMTDIYNVLAIDRIQRFFPHRFKMVPIHCSESDLSELIDNYYDYELSIDGVLREMESLIEENEEELLNIQDQESYTNPTVRLIDALLFDAIKCRASDMHFEPEDSYVRLRYRIDGKLKHIRAFHKDYWMPIAVRIKIISGMNIAESRAPQDGRINYNVLGRQIDFRVATQPTIHGENIVLRVLDKRKALLPMEELGYNKEATEDLHKALKRPEGIIVVTGPTGSGKTTTLYSVLSYINNPDVNIMTLEDPVEYQLPMIRQSNVREASSMSFAGGVKSILRQDPDIIFIGEVRDEDTATMAVRSAMTGHLVFTTLHTNDALGTIPRLVDIGIQPSILADSIVACVAQRLARKLCEHCKHPRPANEEECKILNADIQNPPTIYEHQGCDACSHTGYMGRIAIAEVILMDDQLSGMIAKNATKQKMLKHVASRGTKLMAEDAINKVLEGLTDFDEVISTVNLVDRL